MKWFPVGERGGEKWSSTPCQLNLSCREKKCDTRVQREGVTKSKGHTEESGRIVRTDRSGDREQGFTSVDLA